MKSAHAIGQGTVVLHQTPNHKWTTGHDALILAERTACMVVLLVCEAVIFWVLLSSMYLAAWPAH